MPVQTVTRHVPVQSNIQYKVENVWKSIALLERGANPASNGRQNSAKPQRYNADQSLHQQCILRNAGVKSTITLDYNACCRTQ
ncbi:hypothetical protein TNCV_2372101 [Trichonephila clavipes]|nr:hypothetical protein TNCV_2372101 [Trichonephila clavipes]